jgi:hypothetical protein
VSNRKGIYIIVKSDVRRGGTVFFTGTLDEHNPCPENGSQVLYSPDWGPAVSVWVSEHGVSKKLQKVLGTVPYYEWCLSKGGWG